MVEHHKMNEIENDWVQLQFLCGFERLFNGYNDKLSLNVTFAVKMKSCLIYLMKVIERKKVKHILPD